MGPRKNQNKAAAGLDLLAKLVQKTVERWTSKSPKAGRIITDVSTGAAIAASLILLIPVTYPAWVVPTAAIIVAVAGKLSVENKKPNNP